MSNNNKNYKKDLIYCLVFGTLVIGILVGVFAYNREGAFDILSCAATVASIVLSVVAMIYTMIEGTNSAKVNQETTSKIQTIQDEIKNLSSKIIELNTKRSELNDALSKAVEKKSEKDNQSAWLAIENLQNYLKENLDE